MLFIIHRSIQTHCPEQWSTGVSFRRESGWPNWNELVGDKLSLMLSSSAGFVKQGIKSDQMQLGIRRAPVIVSFLSSACFIASRLWKARVCKLLHYSRYSSHGLHTACLLKYVSVATQQAELMNHQLITSLCPAPSSPYRLHLLS